MNKKSLFTIIIVIIVVAAIILSLFVRSASLSNNTDNNDVFTLYWSVPFGDQTVVLSRLSSGNEVDTFWGKTAKIIKDKNETIDTIYAKFPNVYSGLVYNENTNQYYFLGASSYQVIKLATEKELSELVITESKSRENKESGVVIINNREELKDSNSKYHEDWRVIKYSDYHVFIGDNPLSKDKWLSDGYTAVCYVPITGTQQYIVFDEPMHSTGSEIDMCEYINSIGIQGAKIK